MDDAPAVVPASAVVARAVQRAALERVATTGAHWIGLVVHATREMILAPAPGADHTETLGERLDEGAALTPMADPETGQDHLGDYGLRPATVGDLLETRDVDGHRVAGELELQCAIEAARVAPRLADELARDHPDLAVRLAEEHAGALAGAGGPLDPAAVLCAEVAAVLAVTLVVMVREQLSEVPIGTNDPN